MQTKHILHDVRTSISITLCHSLFTYRNKAKNEK